MKILLTGACGFVGRTIAMELPRHAEKIEILGLDNLSRRGSELNRQGLRERGITLQHGDIRNASDIESLPACDFVIDAAANPSVLAGLDGRSNSRQVMEHNLGGTINLLEYCKRHQAGFLLLSTSRVYSIAALAGIRLEEKAGAFQPTGSARPGLTNHGITEDFSTQPPLSLYGTAKLASEYLALEYGKAFGFPVWINRCGVLAGGGQFGRADQGIFSFWIHSYRARRPLQYLGFGGEGFQVRDCLHPRDFVPAILRQLEQSSGGRICNFGGGEASAMSLRQLSEWCATRFGSHEIARSTEERPFDLPWLVLDCARAAEEWQWQPQTPLEKILEEIAEHAGQNPDWLDLTS
ncbi:MAG: NAD-dependent epimerase/dehydratase family protein [Blastocatellia bacterium]|nr:NAD-dependent epimerase/dehydratase family protein [Blastocatellia bacterium]